MKKKNFFKILMYSYLIAIGIGGFAFPGIMAAITGNNYWLFGWVVILPLYGAVLSYFT